MSNPHSLIEWLGIAACIGWPAWLGYAFGRASAIEAQRATTTKIGVVHESAVPERQTPTTEGDS